MATNLESDFPSSPRNDESDGEEQHALDPGEDSREEDDREVEEETVEEEDRIDDEERVDRKSREKYERLKEEEDTKPALNDVASILKKLQSSGALIKKPKQEYNCKTCEESFTNWDDLENHLIQHVSLPTVLLDKLPSDEEDAVPSGDDNWSDEDEMPSVPQLSIQKTSQKINISQILNKPGLSIKNNSQKEKTSSDSALNRLSGLGFTIKKNSVMVKKEKPDSEMGNKDVMHKLGQLGGIKLKLKCDGNKANTFKVVNGLKDFKASDEEDEEDKSDRDEDSDQDKNDEEASAESEDDQSVNCSRKNSVSSDRSDKNKTTINEDKRSKSIIPKPEPDNSSVKAPSNSSALKQILISKPSRPAVKQTPKRGIAALPASNISNQKINDTSSEAAEASTSKATMLAQETIKSLQNNTSNIVVKEEVQNSNELESMNIPLFSDRIKSERTSPIPNYTGSTPVISTVKTEPEPSPQSSQPIFQSESSSMQNKDTSILLPVTKVEDAIMTVIEINGDSNDEDDDCCVVSATPAPDVKPVIPKTESAPFTISSTYQTSQSNYTSASVLPSQMSSNPSTEKQHSFNWNAPDSKSFIDCLDKSADDMFDSLLSSGTKKENLSSLSDASEYISLDTLGPQHSCDVCNTRYTTISLLEEHKRISGHSMSLVSPASSTLLPYNPSNNLLTSLLPVKQLAEQVGKLSGMGGVGPGYTHQQNVMINIQAYPGAGGVMVPPPPYNNYSSAQGVPPGYPQSAQNMYGVPGQGMSGQYSNHNYMGQSGYGQQYQQSKSGYPGSSSHSTYSNSASTSMPYSTASPLQSMQQAVYGQSSPLHNSQSTMGQMGPPGSSPSHPYAPASSPGGTMKPPTSTASGIRIQNVQTFGPGQLMSAPGSQQASPQMPSAPIRMASGANVSGPRPRMPAVRGARPSIRPGIQVHGQLRGVKPNPRMPLKRPGGPTLGPSQKRRPDMLLPGKHDNEDCQVMAMQKQRDGLPMIHSVQGAKDKLSLGSQISITKKTVNKEASAMANVLASRGISVKQKPKSRSPTPERPIPHIPNLGAGVSIKHTSKSSNFSIPEAKVGGGMLSCKICKKMFMNHNSLSVHMSTAHPQSKYPVFKCDECPASYPKSLQLQHHKRVFHNVTGANRELGLPVVDFSQEENLQRLNNLGIYSYIPLANREQPGGCFGIPVISVHNMQNGLTTSLQALGADGLLSLGPLKPLPNS